MKRVRLNSKSRKAFQGRSRGFTLIEVLIALAIVGVIAIAVLSALSTASTALMIADKRATAESLARSQMEYVKNQPYDEDYGRITPPERYDITLVVEQLQTGLQKITVTIKHDDKEVITLEDYKRAP